MTIPMPEPLECTCMSRGNSCWTCVDTIGWDPEEECPSCPVHAGPTYNETKRLTDVECAAHYWQACQGHTLAQMQKILPFYERSDDPDRFAIHRKFLEAATWHRFFTRPHALEES